MVFDFIESGINLFDDTFTTIKNLFKLVMYNDTPTTLKNCFAGITSNGYLYIRWVLTDDTYYTLHIMPATPRIRLLYYNGSSTSTICTFTIS